MKAFALALLASIGISCVYPRAERNAVAPNFTVQSQRQEFAEDDAPPPEVEIEPDEESLKEFFAAGLKSRVEVPIALIAGSSVELKRILDANIQIQNSVAYQQLLDQTREIEFTKYDALYIFRGPVRQTKGLKRESVNVSGSEIAISLSDLTFQSGNQNYVLPRPWCIILIPKNLNSIRIRCRSQLCRDGSERWVSINVSSSQ